MPTKNGDPVLSDEIPDREERDRAVETRDAYGRDAYGRDEFGPDGRRIDPAYGRDVMTGGTDPEHDRAAGDQPSPDAATITATIPVTPSTGDTEATTTDKP